MTIKFVNRLIKCNVCNSTYNLKGLSISGDKEKIENLLNRRLVVINKTLMAMKKSIKIRKLNLKNKFCKKEYIKLCNMYKTIKLNKYETLTKIDILNLREFCPFCDSN